MQTPRSTRLGGYSDFFSSGFRVFAARSTTRQRPVSMYSLPGISSDIKEYDPKPSKSRRLSRQNSGSTHASRRSRRFSAFVFPSTSSNEKASSPPPSDAPVQRHTKRSSIFEFPSKLIEKVASNSSTSSDAQSFIQFEETRRKLRDQSSSTATEVWITTGGPVTRARLASMTSPSEQRPPIDPFSPSPDSRSFFIDLSDSPSISPTNSKRESFLSFSGSSRNSRNSWSGVPRQRDRPTSIHSMPLPLPQSRSSSHQSRQFRRLSRDKYDSAFTLEEESPILPDETPALFTQREALADIDWRQFHLELLDDDDDD